MERKYSFRRYKWNAFLYGRGVLETMQMDILLSTFNDGQVKYPYRVELPNTMEPYLVERRMDKLVEDGFVKTVGEGFRITTKGAIHLGKGGYTSELKKERRSLVSFWISVIAILLSVSSFVISLLR